MTEVWLGYALSRIDERENWERGGNLESPIGVLDWSMEGEKDGTQKGTDKNIMRKSDRGRVYQRSR